MGGLKHVEVELKFPVLNSQELVKKLNSLAQHDKSDFQKDTYYIPKHRNFLETTPVSEWLRLREAKGKFSINYKNWHKDKDPKSVSCDEFETKIEDLDALRKIFASLNFEEVITVEKARNTWMYKDVEIAIDSIKELGDFIELEAKGNFNNVEEAKAHLYAVLKELNAQLGPQDFKGYPYSLLEKRGLLKTS